MSCKRSHGNLALHRLVDSAHHWRERLRHRSFSYEFLSGLSDSETVIVADLCLLKLGTDCFVNRRVFQSTNTGMYQHRRSILGNCNMLVSSISVTKRWWCAFLQGFVLDMFWVMYVRKDMRFSCGHGYLMLPYVTLCYLWKTCCDRSTTCFGIFAMFFRFSKIFHHCFTTVLQSHEALPRSAVQAPTARCVARTLLVLGNDKRFILRRTKNQSNIHSRRRIR